MAGRSGASGTGSSVVAARTLVALDHVGQVVACPLPAAGAASACGAYRPASVVPDYRVVHGNHSIWNFSKTHTQSDKNSDNQYFFKTEKRKLIWLVVRVLSISVTWFTHKTTIFSNILASAVVSRIVLLLVAFDLSVLENIKNRLQGSTDVAGLASNLANSIGRAGAWVAVHSDSSAGLLAELLDRFATSADDSATLKKRINYKRAIFRYFC